MPLRNPPHPGETVLQDISSSVNGGANQLYEVSSFTNPIWLNGYAAGIAAVLEPGQRWLVAVAAATYAVGQELTIAAAGRAAVERLVGGQREEAGLRAGVGSPVRHAVSRRPRAG